jgi:rhodanese-related sulfurtransferase
MTSSSVPGSVTNKMGCLISGIKAPTQGAKLPSIPMLIELGTRMEKNNLNILDVRKGSEFQSEHLEGAENMPLDYISDNMASIEKDKTYYVHCAGGYRSMIFASILKARGFDNLIDVDGGFKALKESGKFKTTDYVCPSILKTN